RHHRRKSGTQCRRSSSSHAQHLPAGGRVEVERHVPMRLAAAIFAATVVAVVNVHRALAGAQPPPSTPHAIAPIDLTGYWVSVVTEDWRYRMVTPPKGDFASVPLNTEGRKVVDQWDPAKDEASGNQCKAYGVAN